MSQSAYRRGELAWPPTRAQWEGLNDELNAIYREMKKLRATNDSQVGTHDILSATHTDASAAAETDGDLITGQAGKWARLARGNAGDVLVISGTAPAWGAVPAHNLLSSVHGDTTAAAVAKGAMIAGSATKWEKIPVGTDGQVLNADSTKTNGVAWTTLSLGSVVVSSVYRSTNQSLTSGVEAAISFDTEHFDVSNMWVVGQPTRLTCPVNEGATYYFTGQVTMGTAFAGTVHLRLYKNGTIVAKNTAAGSDLSSGTESHQVNALISLAAGDFVELKVLLEIIGGGIYPLVGGTDTLLFQAMKATPQSGAGGGGDIKSDGTVAFAADESMGNHKLTNVTDPTSAQDAATKNYVDRNDLHLLSSQTAAASATLDFTSVITALYDEYLIEFLDILPATNAANFIMRCSTDNGVSYDAGANYAYAIGYASTASASGGAGNAATTSGLLSGPLSNTAARGGTSGFLRLFNPASATAHKHFVGEFAVAHSDTNRYVYKDGVWYLSTTAVNALRFLMDSGNIASGTIRIYGIGKG
jgi:hypothetical protein